MSENWIDAGAADRIGRGRRAVRARGPRYALYRTTDDRYFATDGLCTHELVDLADGFVMGTIIECPMHNGRFDFTTGEAKGAPACINLATYPAKIEGGKIGEVGVRSPTADRYSLPRWPRSSTPAAVAKRPGSRPIASARERMR